MLDAILMDGDSLIPHGTEGPDFTPMGRFGTVLLVNGEAHYHKMAQAGEVIRFILTNVANTRTFNLYFGVPVKLVGGDDSRFEKEQMVNNVVIAPAQRYVVEVRYPKAGDFYITNSVVALDHMMGEFFNATDTVGMVMVDKTPATPDYAKEFQTLRANAAVTADVDKFRAEFDRPPDKTLLTGVEMENLPIIMMLFMNREAGVMVLIKLMQMAGPRGDAAPFSYSDIGVRFGVSRTHVRKLLKEAEAKGIDWQVKQGTVTKIRLVNDIKTFHPMNHPIHLHGQRFLVVARDGKPVDDQVWTDTVLLPVGQAVDILVENANPGTWMLHCHIAEHLGSGMMANYTVTP